MIIKFQLPCYVQGHQPPDQAAQSHIQPGLECLQGWGIHSLLGQPVVWHHHFPSSRLFTCIGASLLTEESSSLSGSMLSDGLGWVSAEKQPHVSRGLQPPNLLLICCCDSGISQLQNIF